MSADFVWLAATHFCATLFVFRETALLCGALAFAWLVARRLDRIGASLDEFVRVHARHGAALTTLATTVATATATLAAKKLDERTAPPTTPHTRYLVALASSALRDNELAMMLGGEARMERLDFSRVLVVGANAALVELLHEQPWIDSVTPDFRLPDTPA